MSVDFVFVLLDIIACLISLERQVNLKTIEDGACEWFAEAEYKEKFSRATCKNALAAMQHPQFQRLLSFMTMGTDPEGIWTRSINYQEWTLCTAIKKLVKHQLSAANPGNLVAVDFDLVSGYSVKVSAFAGLKPVESMKLKNIRATLEIYGSAFIRAYSNIIPNTIKASGFVEEVVQVAPSAPAEEVARKMAEGPTLSYEEVVRVAQAVAKVAKDLQVVKEDPADVKVMKTLNWLKIVKKNIAAFTGAPAAAQAAQAAGAASTESEWTEVRPRGVRAGAGGGR
jgi:hypothetical protein